jgi:hypothetical protein
MSNKTEIVVLKASYRKVFSAIFRRVSFSTATPDSDSYHGRRFAFQKSDFLRKVGTPDLEVITV